MNYKLELYRKQWGFIDKRDGNQGHHHVSQYTDHQCIHQAPLVTETAFSIRHPSRVSGNKPGPGDHGKTAPKRKREKHTVEGFQKIRDIAPDWLQRAMDIALPSLQRRET
ncbi:MAG: hypothetical protein R3E95_22475 [Thiolinea sp.]